MLVVVVDEGGRDSSLSLLLLLLLLSLPAASSSLPLCALMVVLYVPLTIFLLSFSRSVSVLPPQDTGAGLGDGAGVNGHMTRVVHRGPVR